jgi:hypothetical protein
MKKISLTVLLLSMGLLSSCATREAVQGASALSLAAAAPLIPVVDGYRTLTGTNYSRRLLVPDVYRLGDGVYVLSNDGGWFTEGRARYGGRGTRHICLSAWVIDLKAERRDSKGRIVLSKHNLSEYFWDSHQPASLTQIPRETSDSAAAEYFRADGKSPYVSLVVGGQTYELMLDQT